MKRFAVLVAWSLSLHAYAEFKDGNKLYSDMTNTVNTQMNALGYIMGVADTLAGATVCGPSSVTAGQIYDMVKQYLEEQPHLRHFMADRIVARVLERQWPCAKKGTGA